MAGEQLKEHAGEGVLVGCAVDRPPFRLLGRHVLGGPEDGAGQGVLDASRGDPGNPKVGQRCPVALANHDVGGRHVSMDDPLRVRVVEG
jgi:hypothetical protein